MKILRDVLTIVQSYYDLKKNLIEILSTSFLSLCENILIALSRQNNVVSFAIKAHQSEKKYFVLTPFVKKH